MIYYKSLLLSLKIQQYKIILEILKIKERKEVKNIKKRKKKEKRKRNAEEGDRQEERESNFQIKAYMLKIKNL